MEWLNQILRIKTDLPDVNPDIMFTVFGYPVANSTLMLILIALIILIGAIVLNKGIKIIPGGFQNLTELIYDYLVTLVSSVTGSRKIAEKIFPVIGTIFIFVFLSNLMTVIPLIGEITFKGVPIFRPPTTDFNTTFSLALVMVVSIQLISIRDYGILGYIGKFIKIKGLYQGAKKGVGEFVLALIDFAIGFLDIISEVAKVVSLSLRLFGNMYAGQVLATVILAGFAYGLPAIWMVMGTLSVVVQTLVFALLVTAYYTISVKLEKEEA